MTWKNVTRGALANLGWQMLLLGGRDPDAPRISVIMYHSVGSGSRMSFDPLVFDNHMAQVREIFPSVMTIGELAVMIHPVKKWTACLTFDDGYADNHEHVLPTLLKYGLRATFFICSGFISGEHNITETFFNYRGLQPMSWSQINDLSAEGMEIGAHSHSHIALTALRPELQFQEMEHSKCLIEDHILHPVSSFAIPFGNRGTYTQTTLTLAAKLFRACCTTRFSTNPSLPRKQNDMLLLNRIEPNPQDSISSFVDKARGRWDTMKWIQRKRSSRLLIPAQRSCV